MSRSLLDHFSALSDPRQAGKVVYPLQEILLLVLCGTLAGAEDFVEIERWGRRKLDFLRRLLPFARGAPSHDTLNDVMNALPAKLFSDCFVEWVETLRDDAPEVVAIDGKTSRRAHGKANAALHLVSAWASRQRLVLGQEAVAGKGNEITAIPLLLERLELTGALVTIDAIGCQREIAKAIRAKGADYLLARHRTIGRRSPRRRASISIGSRRPPSTPSRASTAITTASRPAAPASVTTSAGCRPAAASRGSLASPTSRCSG